MDWPALRRDPLRPEPGAPKRARQAIRAIVEGGPVTIRVARLNKSWGWRKGMWVAWVEECPDDMFGFCAIGDSQHMALMRLGQAFHRVMHVCTKNPSLIKTAYRTEGWAYAPETKDKLT